MSTEYSVEIRSVVKRFGSFVAVDDVSLSIPRGEFFSLLGPSGCGKTTLLRMLAGFEHPTAGSILIDGREVAGVPPYDRPVHLVFQHYALFPHLTVEKNVGFGLRYQRVGRAEQRRRVGDALAMVRLDGLGPRRPDQLSGGQRQRVALARALVLRPKVLLLDEPLGALDQKLRKEMQVELKQLQREIGITFVFVTHDQEEALTMSDRLAVMNAGRVEQADAAPVVFERPATRFVAAFLGATNIVDATVLAVDDGILRIAAGGMELTLRTGEGSSSDGWISNGRTPASGANGRVDSGDAERRAEGGPNGATAAPVRFELGQRISFVVRPEKMSLRSTASLAGGASVSTPVVVEQRVYQGVNTVWTVRTGDGRPLTIFQQNAEPFDGSGPAAGDRMHAWWDPRHAVVLPPESPSEFSAAPPKVSASKIGVAPR